MQASKTPIYQSKQIREFERLSVEQFGIPAASLMQRAGRAAFDFLLRRWPKAQKIAVFCGGGNNGGDGYVLAQLAAERGIAVNLWQVGSQDKQSVEAKAAREACIAARIPMRIFDEQVDLGSPDVIIDAICGIGVKEALREEIVVAIKKIERVGAPILALDMPTGVNADTGAIMGAVLYATATITFIAYKLGLLTGQGTGCAGELILNDLQLPQDLFTHVVPVAEKIYLPTFAAYLKPRTRDWHKGLSGHVLIIGGDHGFSGAVQMAARAALRVGAGLVSVATRKEHAALMSVNCPEIMSHGVETEQELMPLFAKASVIVLGPGLGQSAWSQALFRKACEQALPLLIDADGLNLLTKQPTKKDNWVLTPHPGEAARLLKTTSAEIQNDRLAASLAINKQYGGICVLKGAGSLVLAPHIMPALCDKGNPGMASAGMGDILSGVIGGLISQGIPLVDAAKLGVYIHAHSGDMAAKEGERGMIATDLLPYLRKCCNMVGFA